MWSEQEPDSIFRVKYVKENSLLVIVCKFVYLLLLLLCLFDSVFLFFCLFVFAVVICLLFCFVFCFLVFFRDISPNTYVIEEVRFNHLSIILVNLWKTWTIRDYVNRDEPHLLRHFSLEQSWYFSLSLSLSGFHLT